MKVMELRKDFDILSRCIDKVIEKPEINTNDRGKVAAIGLMAKANSCVKATACLIKANFFVEAEILARVILETVFYFAACLRNDEAARQYWGQDFIFRRKILSKHLEHSGFLGNIDKETLSGLKQELKDASEYIERQQIRRYSAEDAAKDAGLSGFYIAYRLHSEVVHSSSRHLADTYMKGDPELGDVIIDSQPNDFESGILSTVNACMSIAISRFREGFAISCDETIEIESKYIQNEGPIGDHPAKNQRDKNRA